tara:strand:+ start:30 stop:503 length:474 start_codon:yes stop_codon:yes gene_type:complete
MPEFDFDYNDSDYQLIAERLSGAILSGDYVRVIVYEMAGDAVTDRIVQYGDSSTKAIFYSALHDSNMTFQINVSPFLDGVLSDITPKTIGSNNNDFKVYKNPTSGNIFIKPNEIFDMMGDVGEGNYQIKIDFLRQLSPNVEIEVDDPDEESQEGEPI